MDHCHYPFSALVAQTPLKVALLLNAVDASIGGALIRGVKGTGKSTAARALSQLLPNIEVVAGCPFNSDPRNPVSLASSEGGTILPARTAGGENPPRTPCDTTQPISVRQRPTPFVELPLNATEDRLVGAMQLEKTLQTGQRYFEPGLLAAANRGVLYVDEVNLLADHLVDLLLDAAASGVNVVEREGISLAHPAVFMLIGTMNPEEGELRPQFLDRFGLCVTAEALAETAVREQIIRRRLDFERDPAAFLRLWEAQDQTIRDQIVLARQRLHSVSLPDSLIEKAARLARKLQTPGHRAEITLVKAARAHAALLEKAQADLADLAAVSPLALVHRLAASPLDSAEQLQQRISQALGQLNEDAPTVPTTSADQSAQPTASDESELEQMAEQMQVPGGAAAGSILLTYLKKKTVKPFSRPINP